uniref:ORF93 n=1 Tax=Spilarctia obliqua nucleopolyhedrovirus TaxID=1638618 RepID=A0A7G9U8I1_9ABAC|nr:ORF93 [Spilarctia obliqua nucleopolyhedrovirus]
MILSLHARRLEFDNVILDLSQLELNDGQPENHYIVFLNVKRAFYKNFIVSCDMSLETFALHVYQNAQLTVDGVAVPRAPDLLTT